MGRRSDVYGIIYGNEGQVLALIVAATLKCIYQRLSAYNPPKVCEISPYGHHGIQVVEESIKWYDDYDYVKAQKELVKRAEMFDLESVFVRIGEDYTDIEQQISKNANNLLYVTRYISADFSNK